jgi:hypothetical protein
MKAGVSSGVCLLLFLDEFTAFLPLELFRVSILSIPNQKSIPRSISYYAHFMEALLLFFCSSSSCCGVTAG